MTKVVIDAAMTLDGYWADAPALGAASADPSSAEPSTAISSCGAVIMSHRSFEMARDPEWLADRYPPEVPVIVFPDEGERRGPRRGARFPCEFAPDFSRALARARKLCGTADVIVVGEASAMREALETRVADEIVLCVVSRAPGRGTPLFGEGMPGADFLASAITTTPGAVHLRLARIERH